MLFAYINWATDYMTCNPAYNARWCVKFNEKKILEIEKIRYSVSCIMTNKLTKKWFSQNPLILITL